MANTLPNEVVRSLLRNAADHGAVSKPFVQALVDALAPVAGFDVAGLIVPHEPGSARLYMLPAPGAGVPELWDAPLADSPSSLTAVRSGVAAMGVLSDAGAVLGHGLHEAAIVSLGSAWAPAGWLCVAAREGSRLELPARLVDHVAIVVGSLMTALQASTNLGAPRSLEQIGYFATMGRLAGGLVHEVNNPATFIALAAGQLEKALSKASNAEELQGSIALARDIGESTRQMRAVVSDFHVLSTVARHAVSGSVDLTRMLRAGVKLTTVAYRTQARVEAEIGDLPACPASFAALVPVVVDLLINAIQSIPPGKGSSCVIECRAEGTDERIDISVRDTGCGIASEDLPRVFEPFFTTRPGQAAGLGLTLARDTVRALGGELRLQSTPDAGTTVEITLPVPQVG